MAAPRVALLVHNRFERDPRVSRHAFAALRGGYRVAVLSVGEHEAGSARWGTPVQGVQVYETRVVRRTLLGRVRRVLQGLSGKRPRPDAAQFGGDSVPAAGSARTGPRRAARDIFTLLLLIRNNIGVFQQFRGVGARLVHANDLNVLLAGYLLARAWRAPLIYDSHELWTQLDEEWSPLLRALLALLEGPLLRRADAVVTVNTPIAEELARTYHAPLPLVVMNCPELPEESNIQAPADAAQAAQPGMPLAVIYQGMLNYQGRGLEGLIDAATQVSGITLALRGPGALRDALQQRIADRGATNVRLLPPVPMADLVRALAGYDVGVVSYLPQSKNFLFSSPNKLFEYMMAGLAVVCSDLPVLREVVSTADCGILYPPGDVKALAEALHALACDPARLARYKENARRAARERYNATVEEGRVLQLYARLLAQRVR
jgi:glycosyltransferase involved in cell wall biosynthesis